VHFTGFIPVGDLEVLYARAGLVVVPSTWEAASGAIFEAFSWGLPVVCADVEPLRAQVEFARGDACFFSPYDPASLAHAVRRAAADRDRYVNASRAAARCLARRTWRDTAKDYADVAAWVAGGGRGPVPRSAFSHDARIGEHS
jgi:glycosyltransferase involved in cell wall biosynthesis